MTGAGRLIRDEVEQQTDLLALLPVDRLGVEGTEELYELLLPLARTIIAKEGVPVPNPVGVPVP